MRTRAASGLTAVVDGAAPSAGRHRAPAESTAVVVGVVRDNGLRLRRAVRRLASAMRIFATVHWYVVESDSGDDTCAELDVLAASLPRFTWRTLGKLAPTMPERTARIACARNACVDAVASDASFRRADYVIVADLDEVNRLIDAAAIASCWARDDWDACTANQRGPYYDIWALRHALWSPDDYWHMQRFLMECGYDARAALERALGARRIVLPEHAPWIAVDSAFGGFAVYRREAFISGRYVGLDGDGAPICEHVPFHASLVARGFRIFINPRLVNTDYTDHTDYLAPLARTRRRLRNGMWRYLNQATGGHARNWG